MNVGEGENGVSAEVAINHERQMEARRFEIRAREEMARVFPGYDVVDQARWDGYKPEEDFGNGRILNFYDGEVNPERPQVLFIYRKEGGFCTKFNNNPWAVREDRIVSKSRPVYRSMGIRGTEEKDWRDVSDIPMALDVTKMVMEGIALTPEVLDQPAFLMKDGSVVSIRQLVKAAEAYKTERKSLKPKEKKLRPKMKDEMRERFEPQDLYKLSEQDLECVRDLVLQRLEYQAAHNASFVIGQERYDPGKISEEIRADTQFGRRVLAFEVRKIGFYEEVLWENAVIREGPAQLTLSD
ncbi:hypothetical protein C4577_04365 [Candidatus Parcubacteria bacterium]|nr:MAG: hypothetical protein C4577_04365 [Candidatus Parcubacteria bacterium]